MKFVPCEAHRWLQYMFSKTLDFLFAQTIADDQQEKQSTAIITDIFYSYR